MALNDDATVVIGAGNFFHAPDGTAKPTDLLSVPVPWENVGNTSIEDIFGITSEGGEATVIGTLQNSALRTRYSTRTEKMTFTVQQFDEASLKLYFGANAPILPDGSVGVPTNPVPTVRAFLAVFVDGDHYFAFYAPKAEIYRNDDMSLSDTESLAGLPLGVTPMPYEGNNWTYAVTPLTAMASAPLATGASAGSPGSFTPIENSIPENFDELTSSEVVADPATAWSAGSYVVLGDSTLAYWDGSAWQVGTSPA